MKRIALLTAIAAMVAAMTCSGASADFPWVPGSNAYIQESTIEEQLETVADFALCSGIRRFGHRNYFPFEQFRVFDCSTERNGRHCSGLRLRVVKGARRGTYRLVPMDVSRLRCFGG